MAAANIIENVTDWLQENVCSEIKLKRPLDDAADESFNAEYKLVAPTAFSLYMPISDDDPPPRLFPSVLVELMGGRHDLTKHTGAAKLRLIFCVWDPGYHAADILTQVQGEKGAYRPGSDQEFYKRRSAGWRDAWNFLDRALRIIESEESIAGYSLDKSQAVEYGMLKEDGAIMDFYPYFYAWATFTLNYSNIRRKPQYEHLL